MHLDLLFGFFIQNIESDRAENNSRSTDNVRPDRRLDPSNFHLAGHFWIRTFYFPYSCRLMLYNAVMISFSLAMLLLCTKTF